MTEKFSISGDECILKKSLLTKPKAIQNSILNLKSAFDSLCLDEKEQAINKSRHNHHNFKLFGGQ